MNYLAHLWIANSVQLPLAGAILGDVVRGRIEGGAVGGPDIGDAYGKPVANPAAGMHPALARSILLHRRIDAVTDRHPQVLAAVRRFEPDQRRYAGIILDMLYDHVLAMHWLNYSTTPLSVFARGAAQAVAAAGPLFVQAGGRAPTAWSFRWLLVSYAKPEGLDRALRRTATRLRRPEGLINAARDWQRHVPQATIELPRLLDDLHNAARAFVAETRA